MAHVNCVFQVEFFSEGCEIVCVCVHVIAVPRLCGSAVPTSIMRNNAKTSLSEKHHLSVPLIRRQRPSMAEDDGLPCAPVFVENLSAILRSYCRHDFSSYCLKMFLGALGV